MTVINKKIEDRTTLVDYLTDFDVESVGIVTKGGNRAPFKILRSETGEVKMLDVIQSVLIPRGATLDDLKEHMKGLHTMEVARVEEFPNYTKFEQRPLEAFKKETLRMEQLEGGALALVGDMTEEDSKAITMRGAMETPMGVDKYGYQITFGDLVYRELDSFLNTMFGALAMAEMPTKQKKQVVNNGLEAFKSYMNMGLDNLDDPTIARFDVSKIEFLNKGVEKVEIKKDAEGKEVRTETPPEMDVEKMIQERVAAALAERDAKMEESVTKVLRAALDKTIVLTDEEKCALADKEAADKAAAERKATEDKIADLEARLAKFEAEDSELESRNDKTVTDDTKTPESRDEKKSVFSGIFSKHKK
jgi:hypothetical protein